MNKINCINRCLKIFLVILALNGYVNLILGQNIIGNNTDSVESFNVIYTSLENDSGAVVMFNSFLLIPGFASTIFASPWNPDEIEMKAIFLETYAYFDSTVISESPWQQYVCGLDSNGNKIVFVRYIKFTDETSYQKQYFLKKIIFVYDAPFLHTLYYNFTTKRLISFDS